VQSRWAVEFGRKRRVSLRSLSWALNLPFLILSINILQFVQTVSNAFASTLQYTLCSQASHYCRSCSSKFKLFLFQLSLKETKVSFVTLHYHYQCLAFKKDNGEKQRQISEKTREHHYQYVIAMEELHLLHLLS